MRREVGSCNFSTDSYKFPAVEIVGAQKFSSFFLTQNSSKVGHFRPGFRILKRKFFRQALPFHPFLSHDTNAGCDHLPAVMCLNAKTGLTCYCVIQRLLRGVLSPVHEMHYNQKWVQIHLIIESGYKTFNTPPRVLLSFSFIKMRDQRRA